MLRFAASQSDIVHSRRAMQDCLERAVELLGAPADLVVFHTSIGHDFPELLAGAAETCPEASVVGCSCAGVIGPDGASEKMRTLGVMAVAGSGEFAVAHADSIRGDNSRAVATAAARDLKQRNPAVSMVQILASGIDIAADEAIRGIESVFGPDVPIFGGTSGDNMRARSTYQFVDQRVLERGLVLVGFADPTLRLVTGVHHGSVPIGRPFEVTRSEANRVFELDGQPAWPFLTGQLGLTPDTDVGDALPVSGLGQEMPAELQDDYDNRHFIHTIFKVDEARQSFYTPSACPVGTHLWLMRRDEDVIFQGVERMVTKVKERLDGRRPVAVFHTDCAARGRFLFNQILKDEIIARIQYPVCEGEPVPWLGTYGFGEFTPVAGHNRFHTQTSSVYALVRDRA